MFLAIKSIIAVIVLCLGSVCFGQDKTFTNSFRASGVYATAEATYYGVSLKYNKEVVSSFVNLTIGGQFTTYFDFFGESEPGEELENDIDSRLIPAISVGLSKQIKKIKLNLELPIGPSVAYTKGVLNNTNIGFTNSYSNTEVLLHFGIGLDVDYKLNHKNAIGLTTFLPIGIDIAWSLPYIGLGWKYSF